MLKTETDLAYMCMELIGLMLLLQVDLAMMAAQADLSQWHGGSHL